MTETKKDRRCFASKGCVHRIDIPGNCHIGCNNPVIRVTNREPWPGSGMFPYCFDPNLVIDCVEFSEDPKDAKLRKNR